MHDERGYVGERKSQCNANTTNSYLYFVKEDMSTAVLSRLHVKRHDSFTYSCVSPGISLAYTAASKKTLPPPRPLLLIVSVRRAYLPVGLLQPRKLNPRTPCPKTGRSTHSTQTSWKHLHDDVRAPVHIFCSPQTLKEGATCWNVPVIE